jgi:hypothetical protein
VTRVDWPSREIFGRTSSPYNYACRNQLGVAYLDGRSPSLIVERGTYNVIQVAAYQLRGGRLAEQWGWDNSGAPKTYSGQGAHWLHAADVDDDRREEVVLGSAVLDDDGRPLWSTGLGHPDHCYVGKIDPDRLGLQIYYGIETRQQANGMCLVEAATGALLWGLDRPTRHVHGYGLCSDIDPSDPGSECYSADTDPRKDFAFAVMHNSRGPIISQESHLHHADPGQRPPRPPDAGPAVPPGRRRRRHGLLPGPNDQLRPGHREVISGGAVPLHIDHRRERLPRTHSLPWVDGVCTLHCFRSGGVLSREGGCL